MAAPLWVLLVPALCGAPATARDHLHVTETAAARANVSVLVQTGDAERDAALVRKREGSPCLCLLEETTWTALNVQHRVVFTAPDPADHTPQDCSGQCFTLCHNKLKHKLNTSEAERLGGKLDVPFGVVAARCSAEGDCVCLDVSTAVNRLKQYRSEYKESIARSNRREKTDQPLEPPLRNILVSGETHTTSRQCLDSCACADGYKGFCGEQWDWPEFLSQDHNCGEKRESIGLKSCTFRQQAFEFKKDDKLYIVELAELRGERYVPNYNVKLEVLRFEAEGMRPARKTKVKVGYKAGQEVSWKVSSNPWGSLWKWTVKDEHGKERFIIKEAKDEDDNVHWEVHEKDGDELFYSSNWMKRAVTDDVCGAVETTLRKKKPGHDIVAWLKCKGEKWLLSVVGGEDAGLIVMTSVFIAKARAHKQR